jgi:hypothetical protein
MLRRFSETQRLEDFDVVISHGGGSGGFGQRKVLAVEPVGEGVIGKKAAGMWVELFCNRYVLPLEFDSEVLEKPPVHMCTEIHRSFLAESVPVANNVVLAVDGEHNPMIVSYV